MKVVTIVKNGRRRDYSADEMLKMLKAGAPTITVGALVSFKGHKGKVLAIDGDQAEVSWEDAALSKVPIADLTWEGNLGK